jgi:hypothetical protein
MSEIPKELCEEIRNYVYPDTKIICTVSSYRVNYKGNCKGFYEKLISDTKFLENVKRSNEFTFYVSVMTAQCKFIHLMKYDISYLKRMFQDPDTTETEEECMSNMETIFTQIEMGNPQNCGLCLGEYSESTGCFFHLSDGQIIFSFDSSVHEHEERMKSSRTQIYLPYEKDLAFQLIQDAQYMMKSIYYMSK